MTRLGKISDRLRERSVSIFDYLADLSRLRTKTIHNIDQYQDVFWFDSLPSDKDCHTIAWGGEDDDQSDDIWLEIRKRPEPKCPPPPVECRTWINERELYDREKIPQLRESIAVAKPPASETENLIEEFSQEPEFLYLTDHPEIRSSFEAYLQRRWSAWAETHQA